MPHVAGLFVYPVKSCRGIALERARLTVAGIEHDREWMVVSALGRFLTQREVPKLALVVPRLESDRLVLSAPGLPDLDVPFDAPGAPAREVKVWSDVCLGRDQGDAAARWFGEALGREVRLLRFDPSKPRPTEAGYSQGVDGRTRFTDGYPVLVLSRASLDDLNSRLPSPLPLDRFRTSLLIDGCDAYAEDKMQTLEANGARLRIVKPCTRCVITTTDQQTATPMGDEPLRTLKTYRWDAKLRGVVFAQNAVVEAPGELAIGMELRAG